MVTYQQQALFYWYDQRTSRTEPTRSGHVRADDPDVRFLQQMLHQQLENRKYNGLWGNRSWEGDVTDRHLCHLELLGVAASYDTEHEYMGHPTTVCACSSAERDHFAMIFCWEKARKQYARVNRFEWPSEGGDYFISGSQFIYVLGDVCVYIYVPVPVCVYLSVWGICVGMFVCLFVWMYTCIHARTHTHTHTHTNIARVCNFMCLYVYVCVCMCVCI